MIRKAFAAVAVSALVLGACDNDDGNGDGVLQRDTTLTTVEDTLMIERTVTVDTMDLDRDTTARRDTLGDTTRIRP